MCGVLRLTRCVNFDHLPRVNVGQDVSDLLEGVDIFDSDSKIQVNPVNQPIQVHTVGSEAMSQGRDRAFHDHLDHRTVVFKYEKRCQE